MTLKRNKQKKKKRLLGSPTLEWKLSTEGFVKVRTLAKDHVTKAQLR